MKHYLKFFPLIILLLLSSCATIKPAQKTPLLSWKQRQAQLNALQNWTVNGVMGVQQNGQSSIVYITWQQQGQQYTQTISGPFNLGGVRIVGQPGHVTLIRSAQQQFTAKSPEILIQQETGYRLPISNLYYWIRGLPAPNMKHHEKFDTQNHLIDLTQQGWHVVYANYQPINNIDLPTKIWISNPQLQVKMVIKKWEI